MMEITTEFMRSKKLKRDDTRTPFEFPLSM
jgi:hypothetical protein